MKTRAFAIGAAFVIAILVLAPGCGKKEDNPAETDTRYVCQGSVATCLKLGPGWQFEGLAFGNADDAYYDACALALPDGRIRIYTNEGSNPGSRLVTSFVSGDGATFEKEPGIRIDSPYAFTPYVIILPDGRYRMYMTDQTTYVDATGAVGIKSAISTDGLTFVMEPGDRLRYLGTGDEAGGVRHSNVVRLADGTYRMYYKGFAHEGSQIVAKILSASSPDGLTWTRDPGVRLDPRTICPPALTFGNPKPYLDAAGTMHLSYNAAQCQDANHKNEIIGIFEATAADGLTFTHNTTPIVKGYYIKDLYKGNPTDPFVTAEDQMVVMTPTGLRMYFFTYSEGSKAEDGVYVIVNPSFR